MTRLVTQKGPLSKGQEETKETRLFHRVADEKSLLDGALRRGCGELAGGVWTVGLKWRVIGVVVGVEL